MMASAASTVMVVVAQVTTTVTKQRWSEGDESEHGLRRKGTARVAAVKIKTVRSMAMAMAKVASGVQMGNVTVDGRCFKNNRQRQHQRQHQRLQRVDCVEYGRLNESNQDGTGDTPVARHMNLGLTYKHMK